MPLFSGRKKNGCKEPGTGKRNEGCLSANGFSELGSETELADTGNAMIEFIVLGLTLMIPTLYFLLAVFNVQSAALAANAASSAAVQYAQTISREELSAQHVTAVAQLATSDFKIPAESINVQFECDAECSQTSTVRVQVTVHAQLPLIPWVAPAGFVDLTSTAVGWGGKYR